MSFVIPCGESCSNCKHYEEDAHGTFRCMDCDGLYFNWKRKPEHHCPDYERAEELEIKEAVLVS